MKQCAECGAEIPNRNKFCSSSCSGKNRTRLAQEEWLRTGQTAPHNVRMIKSYLQEVKNCCWECGLSTWNGKPITLEVEHVDGNGYNHNVNNLKLLCPNCHSQTPTYKAKNKGRGRAALAQLDRAGNL